jgi:hypothetical protein
MNGANCQYARRARRSTVSREAGRIPIRTVAAPSSRVQPLGGAASAADAARGGIGAVFHGVDRNRTLALAREPARERDEMRYEIKTLPPYVRDIPREPLDMNRTLALAREQMREREEMRHVFVTLPPHVRDLPRELVNINRTLAEEGRDRQAIIENPPCGPDMDECARNEARFRAVNWQQMRWTFVDDGAGGGRWMMMAVNVTL